MIWDYLYYIFQGTYWTFLMVGGGLAIGFIVGLIIAMGQVYGDKVVKASFDMYVAFFRSVPLLVLLFLFFWAIFPALGFGRDSLFTCIAVLGLRSGAYSSQVFRGAIVSVGEGQLVAATALGMSKLRGVYSIVLPQALRISLPGWSNEYAIMLKDTANCFALGVLEILNRTSYVVGATHESLIPYFFAGTLFIVYTYGGTKIVNILYEKTRITGLVRRM